MKMRDLKSIAVYQLKLPSELKDDDIPDSRSDL